MTAQGVVWSDNPDFPANAARSVEEQRVGWARRQQAVDEGPMRAGGVWMLVVLRRLRVVAQAEEDLRDDR